MEEEKNKTCNSLDPFKRILGVAPPPTNLIFRERESPSLISRVMYSTGTGYFSGLFIGGLFGLRQCLLDPIANGTNIKLRINSILNSCVRRGSRVGNATGVVTFIFSSFLSLEEYFSNLSPRFIHHLTAGAATGALFKSTGGVGPCIYGGLIGAAFSSTFFYTKKLYLNHTNSTHKH